MIYGEKFLNLNNNHSNINVISVTESAATRVNLYKEIYDKAFKLIEIQYKWLKSDDECLSKILPIYLNINEKNAESNYNEIQKILRQSKEQQKKIYDFKTYSDEYYKLNEKIEQKCSGLLFIYQDSKNEEINELREKFKNKLSKIINDTDKYYNKYKESVENLKESKLYKKIENKSDWISDNVHDIYTKFDNSRKNIVNSQLDQTVWTIKGISKDISRILSLGKIKK